MNRMFYFCYSLDKLDLSNFDTYKVTDMSYMFSSCKGLTNLNNLNTKNVRNLQYMFSDDSSLLNINLSSFDTSNLIYINHMFHRCSSLIYLNLSNFYTKVNNFAGLFGYCSYLSYIDIRRFSDESVMEKEANTFIFPGKPASGTVYYNSKFFNEDMINVVFKDWEKININYDLNLQ